jgi:putative FmdB family regulatory protein
MPTYDYQCDDCGHTFELFQSITEAVKRKCPDCGKLKLRRLFGTGGAVVFKGSGFYQTDYRSDSYKKAAEADTKAGSGDSAKHDKKKTEPSDKPPKTDPGKRRREDKKARRGDRE